MSQKLSTKMSYVLYATKFRKSYSQIPKSIEKIFQVPWKFNLTPVNFTGQIVQCNPSLLIMHVGRNDVRCFFFIQSLLSGNLSFMHGVNLFFEGTIYSFWEGYNSTSDKKKKKQCSKTPIEWKGNHSIYTFPCGLFS